jgi:hypothetical protein
MAYIVAGLTKGAHQARGLIRALADAGFPREEVDMAAGPIAGLVEMGIPENEAHVFAEGARRGGAIVVVKADDEFEAEQAALLMHQHGAVDVESCDAGWRRLGWSGRIPHPASMVSVGHYALVFGDYPSGSGRIYPDLRAARHDTGQRSESAYAGPERRHTDKPYEGMNRRAA